MATEETAITFRLPPSLKADFEQVAEAEHRSVKGELVNLMEKRVAEFKTARGPSQLAFEPEAAA